GNGDRTEDTMRATDNQREAEAFFAKSSPEIADIARKSRALVQRHLPEAWEKVYPKMNVIRYGTTERMSDLVFYINPRPEYVNIGLIRGTSLPDPDNLLEGTGKDLRHVKIRTAEQLEAPALHALMQAAVSDAKRSRE